MTCVRQCAEFVSVYRIKHLHDINSIRSHPHNGHEFSLAREHGVIDLAAESGKVRELSPVSRGEQFARPADLFFFLRRMIPLKKQKPPGRIEAKVLHQTLREVPFSKQPPALDVPEAGIRQRRKCEL